MHLFLLHFLLLSVARLGEPQVCGWAVCAGSGVYSSKYAPLVVLFLCGIAFLEASYDSGRASLEVSWRCVFPVFVNCKVWSWLHMGRGQVLFAKVLIVRPCQGTGECLTACT